MSSFLICKTPYTLDSIVWINIAIVIKVLTVIKDTEVLYNLKIEATLIMALIFLHAEN